jgi:transcription antitermination factor NusG
MKRWFILRTDVQGELRAYHWLGIAFEPGSVALPLEAKTVKANGYYGKAQRHRIVYKPLIPGYIFLREAERQPDWEAVRNTIGVRDFLTLDGDMKAMCSDDMVQALIATAAELNKPKPKLAKRKKYLPVDEALEELRKRLDTNDSDILDVVLPGRSPNQARTSGQRPNAA